MYVMKVATSENISCHGHLKSDSKNWHPSGQQSACPGSEFLLQQKTYTPQ